MAEHHPVAVGDHVSTGPNLFPHFVIVAIDGELAWVRDTATGVNAFAAVARCRPLPSNDNQAPANG